MGGPDPGSPPAGPSAAGRLAVRPLPAFGVEVTLDPHAALDPARAAELRALFLRHHLVLVRSDGMTVAETVRICGAVATVLTSETGAAEAYVSSARGDAVLPDVEIPWHSDMNFNLMPHLGASLYAEAVDDDSSPTWFASAAAAARLLPEDLRRRVEPLVALHELPAIPPEAGDPAAGVPGPEPDDAPRVEATRHPVLWPHPITGEPLLYVSRRQALQDRVLPDVSEPAEREILDALFAVLYRPENTYEHRWREGDLVIWDNLAVQHRRATVRGRRTVRRLALVDGDGHGDRYFAIQAMVKAHVHAAP